MNRFILLLSLLVLAGCDDVHAPHAIPSDKFPAGAYPKNVAVEWTLKDALVAGQTIVKDGTKDQPLSVSQPMRNIRDYAIEVQYQFTFLDSTGRPIQPDGGWRNITLEGRVERFLEGAALDTNAVDWRLTVRPAK
jgi:uncharacterized protein YcfL